MSGDATILGAAVTNAAAILQLQRLAHEIEARLYDDWTIPPLTQTIEDIRNEFGRKIFLKAEVGKLLFGSVRAACEKNVCEIGRLIAHPHYQGQLIATPLMHAIEAVFPQAERLELFTRDRSVGNIRL